MPAFTRRAGPSTPAPPAGTISSPSHSHPLLPTGVPSLDDLLGGGLPLGSILLVLTPDQHAAWGRLLTRYFLAQGLVSGQSALVLGEEDGIRETVKGCMWVDERSGEGSESDGEGAGGAGGEGRGGGKIAWRYEGMSKFKTTTGRSSGLNLMRTIPSETLRELESDRVMSYIPLEEHTRMSEATAAALGQLHKRLEQSEKGKATRVAVHELGSADWGTATPQDIHRFLHSLKHLIRDRSASAIVTLPHHLVTSVPEGWRGSLEGWIKSLAWVVDGCIEMRGFADNPGLSQHFAPLHGLLTLHSFPTSHALLPPTLRRSTLLGVSQSATNERGGGGAGENNLGFRVKRKGLVIETAHLGIEGGSSERRTAPVGDVSGVLDAGHAQAHPHDLSSGVGGRDIGQVEGVEIVGKVKNAEAAQVPVGKIKKDRPRVRFGGDNEVMEVTVDRADKQGEKQSSAGHSHHHAHTPRPQVRHDRPDLYEF